jgi:hypothetical protein
MNETQYRLVLDVHIWHWGSDGLELKEKFYFLQTRDLVYSNDPPWRTLPVVMHNELSEAERIEIKKVLCRTGAYAPTATCRHGVHPYECLQGCDPYKLTP